MRWIFLFLEVSGGREICSNFSEQSDSANEEDERAFGGRLMELCLWTLMDVRCLSMSIL